jgi:hypothetical protein
LEPVKKSVIKDDQRRHSTSSSVRRSISGTKREKKEEVSIELQPQPVPLYNPISSNSLTNLETQSYTVELLYDFWKNHPNTIDRELRTLFSNVIIPIKVFLKLIFFNTFFYK